MFRGKNFYNFGYGNLRDYPLADCKFAIEQLADRYAYIDRDRVGIYGHSGGGMMAAAAILTYPDFFKVAVAASGNYDNLYQMVGRDVSWSKNEGQKRCRWYKKIYF